MSTPPVSDRPLSAAEARHRFLILRGLRWLSTGLIVPVFILIMLDRGLSLADIGLAVAAQGVATLVLELPTGGLADAIGRRRVLLIASIFSVGSFLLLLVAESLLLFAVVWAIQGVYRALESGPLDAWYVDTAQAADPEADIEATLARGAVVLSSAIASGSLLSSGLVAWQPLPGVDPLVTPVLAALVVMIIEVLALIRLMREPEIEASATLRQTVRAVPTVVREAVGIVRGSRVLTILVTIEVLWGLGMVAFELFTPAKLELILQDADLAAQIVGPMQTGAWIASAVGAALVPRLVRVVGGAQRAATVLLAAQALFVVAIGLATGPIGVVIAFLVTMMTHGAANPVHQGLLHRAVTHPGRRATVVSANSLAARLGGLIGSIGLGALGDATSLNTAILAGAGALALAAPLYLRARVPTSPAEGTLPA
ncbi:MFS transporter [Euzebya tangerina]|uniref:MFS transporter n=1 Tax=Euzebya tangerina TaxID=591198 RepID=UPI000E32190D|nr:MFS transporter [Euzebya tangerina]